MLNVKVYFPTEHTAQQVRDHLYQNYLRDWTEKQRDSDFSYDEPFRVVVLTEGQFKILESMT